jgi:hypothetical protein
MSSASFSQGGQYNTDIVTLIDETGRSLDCYLENSVELDDSIYILLLPIDSPVVIMTWDEEEGEDDEISDAIIIEEPKEIQTLFADAKAVLAELNLVLQNTAFTLTVNGELPPLHEDEILSLEVDDDDDDVDTEDLQFLASFYHQQHKYSIYSPVAPLLFVACDNKEGQLELLAPDDPNLESILNFLLYDDLDHSQN